MRNVAITIDREFESLPKHKYDTFAGDRDTQIVLRAALRWEVLPYPKRNCGISGSLENKGEKTNV